MYETDLDAISQIDRSRIAPENHPTRLSRDEIERQEEIVRKLPPMGMQLVGEIVMKLPEVRKQVMAVRMRVMIQTIRQAATC